MTAARTPKKKKKGRSKRPGAGGGLARRGGTKAPPPSAESLAKGQREISISEFFAKNRHLLGFDNPRKALLTTVKEAVDNALDACEEFGVLPEIHVQIDHLPEVDENRYRVTVEDNGPGIVRKQIDNIFGKLLYGSKFHRLKMSRGQQGIGISAAGMYGVMTTGRPMIIVTRASKRKPAHHVELSIDTTRNRPEVAKDVETDDFPAHTGTRVSVELEGRYSRGRTSVDEYLHQTAIANPHARFTYRPPQKRADDEEEPSAPLLDEEPAAEIRAAAEDAEIQETTLVGDTIVFPRTVDELPPEPVEIKPHPRGVELGTLMQMLRQTDHKHLGAFLQNEFSRISPKVAKEICEHADLTPRTWVKQVQAAEAEAVYRAIQKVRVMSPPLNCLAPIGVRQILAGLLKGVRAEFYTAATRPTAVYRGNPFQVEVGIAFGGDLPHEQTARIIRFANRVPLLYQQSACAAFKAVLETSWRGYGLTQPRGAPPEAPLVVMVHMASVWVPFTSESKEAIADYDEIRKEIRLGLQETGRKLGAYLRRRQRIKREGERRNLYARYIGEVARALHTIDERIDREKVLEGLQAAAEERTALADQEVDEEGRLVERADQARRDEDEDVIVIDREAPESAEAPPEPPARDNGAARRKPKKSRGRGGGGRTGGGQTALFHPGSSQDL